MPFDVPAADYAQFMGRYADPLARLFVDLVLGAGPTHADARALDVGCGPGTVTAVLVERLGAERVAAVDPSPTLAAATAERFPDVEVREAAAEALPFGDSVFTTALAQLVVPFMADPVRGLTEMGRVVRPGGLVAACAWDVSDGPVAPFWRVADELDPGAGRATDLPGAREGQLADLLRQAGLTVVTTTTLTVRVEVASFEEWWSPFAFGVGPAGEYFASLEPGQREALRQACRARLTEEPIRIAGVARAAVARRE